jgi:prepilin peptidase CpaA
LFTTTLWDHGWWQLQWGVVIGASLLAAVTDLRSRRISNWLTGPLLAAGLGWAFWQAGWAGLADSALACVLLAVPYIVLFVVAGGGAGDAKMMGAVGAWLGVINGLVALVGVSICAILVAVAWSLAKKRLAALSVNVTVLGISLAGRLLGVKDRTTATDVNGPSRVTMPYGLAIFAGVTVAAAGVWIWQR